MGARHANLVSAQKYCPLPTHNQQYGKVVDRRDSCRSDRDSPRIINIRARGEGSRALRVSEIRDNLHWIGHLQSRQRDESEQQLFDRSGLAQSQTSDKGSKVTKFTVESV